MKRSVRLVLMSVVASVGFLFAAYCDEGKAIVIRGVEGRGKTRQLALTDAFRSAISKALGSYIVTQKTLDGETLDTKIFDNSDAVIKTHKVVKQEDKDGKWSVIIDAEIIPNQMIQYIHKKASAKVGEGELANALAKREAINNAIGSLKLLFQNWRENVYRLEKYGSLSISAADDVSSDTVQISVPFIATLRWDNYYTLLEKIRNVLSRIAIDKERGEYSKQDELWRCWGDNLGYFFRNARKLESNYTYYNRVGLVHKDKDGDIEIENPNGYGEIIIYSERGANKIVYESYIVPNQIEKAFEELLQDEAEVQFIFESKGGRTIASSSLSAELSFWHVDDYKIRSVIIGEKISMELGNNRDCTVQNLYRAAVPVSLEDAGQIVECNITVRSRDKEYYDYPRTMVTKGSINQNEWIKIDKKPQVSVPSPKVVERPTSVKETERAASSPCDVKAQGEEAGEETRVESEVFALTISEKDKKLKKQMLELCRLAPDYAAAGKWFKLSKSVEADDLRQVVLKIVGAALRVAKKSNVYDSKVRPLLDDPQAFDQMLRVQCSKCEGQQTQTSTCVDCHGTGRCCFSGCRGGQRLSTKIAGGLNTVKQWTACTACKGTALCKKCMGEGKRTSKCGNCNGRGNVFSRNAALKAYRNYVKIISQAMED